MTSRTPPLLPLLVAAVFACCSLNAQAIPKAAEQEGAPVTTGADVMRPKPSTRAVVLKKANKKSGHPVNKKSGKKAVHPHKAMHRKK